MPERKLVTGEDLLKILNEELQDWDEKRCWFEQVKKTGIIEPSGCNWDAYDFRCSGVKDFDASKKMARQIVADAKVKYNLK